MGRAHEGFLKEKIANYAFLTIFVARGKSGTLSPRQIILFVVGALGISKK